MKEKANKCFSLPKILQEMAQESDDDECDDMILLNEVVMARILELKYILSPFNHVPTYRLDRTIDSFNDNQISDYFRFISKAHLRQLLFLLHIPNLIRLDYGSVSFGCQKKLDKGLSHSIPSQFFVILRESHTFCSDDYEEVPTRMLPSSPGFMWFQHQI